MIEIKDIGVFEGISDSTLERIYELSDEICLKKNRSLYMDREKLDYVYFLLEGMVTLSKCNENGESRIIFTLKPGDMINQPIMRKNTSAVECWGFENSKIMRIKFEDFDSIMQSDYILARNCILYMENRIRRLYRQLKNFVTSNLDKRLAAKLYRLALEHGMDQEDGLVLISIDLSVTYIARTMGCQRESLSRALKILLERGIVKRKGKKFYVNMKDTERYFKA